MNYTQLSLDQAPGIETPLRFFLTAPLFAIIAAILLIISGPELLQNRWLPETLALTHLLTLGFITMVMMGAVFQMLPVLIGSSIWAAGMSSRILHIFFSSGILFFTLGLSLSDSVIIKIAILFLLLSLLGFLSLVSVSLFKNKSTQATAIGMRIAVIGLWVSVFMGGFLAIGHGWDSVPLLRQFTKIHVAWAAIGWVSIMIVSIAYQVIPMFQVTNDYPLKIKKYFIPLLFSCLLLWSVVQYFEVALDAYFYELNSLLVIVPGSLLLAFVVFTIRLQIQRKKRLADASMYFWISGLSCLAISILVLIYSVVSDAQLSVLIGILFFTGFVFSVINAMLYKIVPFLVWLHLNKKIAFTDRGIADIPTMNEVISRKKMLYQYYLHILALVLSVLTFYLPSIFFYAMALAWLINWSLLFIHLLQAVKLYQDCLKPVQAT